MIKLTTLIEAVNSKLKVRIQKLVDEANRLIELAIDEDGDKFGIVDTSGTWQTEDIYLPIEFANSRLIVKYYETTNSEKIIKDVISANNLEYDALPELKRIIRLYKKALNKHNIQF